MSAARDRSARAISSGRIAGKSKPAGSKTKFSPLVQDVMWSNLGWGVSVSELAVSCPISYTTGWA